MCFEISNFGDTLLADFELRDPVLDIELNDLILLFGDLGTSLEPGDSIVLAAETVAERWPEKKLLEGIQRRHRSRPVAAPVRLRRGHGGFRR